MLVLLAEIVFTPWDSQEHGFIAFTSCSILVWNFPEMYVKVKTNLG